MQRPRINEIILKKANKAGGLKTVRFLKVKLKHGRHEHGMLHAQMSTLELAAQSAPPKTHSQLTLCKSNKGVR